jgi:UDP-glucose:(heptosyl)LPS alpha-1,3-glucosyltransferase
MKIAILTERADITLGGAERSVRDLAEELKRRGLEVMILAAAGDRDSDNLYILCPDQKGKRTPLSVYEEALKNHLKSNHYDLLHSTLPILSADVYQPRGGSYRETMLQNIRSYPNPLGRLFKRAFHSLNRRRTEYLRAEETLLRTNPKVIVAALSEYVKGHFVRHYGLAEERIAVIPNGVPLPQRASAEMLTALRNQILDRTSIGRNPDAIIFLFAANNFRLKGLRELILALAKASRITLAPLVLAVAGKGKQAPWRNLAWLKGIDSRVVFLGPLPDMDAALEAADAAVLPTWYDPSSRFILEALALRKPVITTAFNGASEFVRSGRHGFVIDRPGNVEALTDALIGLSSRESIEPKTRAITEDNLPEKVSIARHAEQLISLYKKILDRKNKTL